MHRQPHVDYDGQIACVLVGNEESTLKIFARDQENKVRLKAANPNYPDIVLEDENNMRVLGVYAGVFKLPRLPGKNVR
ncbi:MAG: LexA family protein [Eubacteriales bacterium]